MDRRPPYSTAFDGGDPFPHSVGDNGERQRAGR
jgi:hypothetical protein